jgi:hypothetical protein
VPLPIRESSNPVSGIIYGATYVLYGITLAFSLYLANQDASEARQTVEKEAGSLEGIFEIAQQLPQPQRDRIQELTESYARVVVEEEWPLMERGAKSQESSQAEVLIDELQKTVVDFEPDTGAEQALYSRGVRLVGRGGDHYIALVFLRIERGMVTGAVSCGIDHGSRPRPFGDLPVTGSVLRQRTGRAGGLRRGAQRHSKTTT